MAEASKMELKEEKQKMDVVKKGNLRDKLDEVTKRDERV